MRSISVIITAGGIGSRMGASLPKQFILIKEKPILMYTLELFYHFDPNLQLILTLPDDWKEYWEQLVVENDFKIPHRVISGGKERYDSIKNALTYCHSDFIAVHDGVRPFVSSETLTACFDALIMNDAVIPVVPVKESLRKKGSDGKTLAVDRDNYWMVQTPQCFTKSILFKAYEQPFTNDISDDASLVEKLGIPIYTVSGNDENIKITTQMDLVLANHLLK